MMGVYISTLFTNLDKKEKLFTTMAYLPKATVQASIGGIALSAGLGVGSLILSVAVLSILITAPLGGILIDLTYKKLLTKVAKFLFTKVKDVNLCETLLIASKFFILK